MSSEQQAMGKGEWFCTRFIYFLSCSRLQFFCKRTPINLPQKLWEAISYYRTDTKTTYYKKALFPSPLPSLIWSAKYKGDFCNSGGNFRTISTADAATLARQTHATAPVLASLGICRLRRVEDIFLLNTVPDSIACTTRSTPFSQK